MVELNQMWCVIPNFPNYAISEHGIIKRLITGKGTYPNRILKPFIRGKYLSVHLYNGNGLTEFQIHKLVAKIFIGDRPLNKQINHKDGNKFNNHFLNLEYVTCQENHIHAFRIGLRHGIKGEKNYFAKLKESEVLKIRELLKQGLPERKIAKMFNVSHCTPNDIKNKTWKHI